MLTTSGDNFHTENIVQFVSNQRDLSDNDKNLEFADISTLKSHRGWVALSNQVGDKESRVLKGLQVKLLSGIGFSQSEVDYTRGIIAGLRWVMTAPDVAQKRYKRED